MTPRSLVMTGICRGIMLALLAAAATQAARAEDEGSTEVPPPLSLPDPSNPPPIAPIPAPLAPGAAEQPPAATPPEAELPPQGPPPGGKPGTVAPGGQAGNQAGNLAGKEISPSDTPPEQRAKLLDELYARLATAPDEATGTEIAQAIEQLWQHSGSPTADLLVARATAAVDAQQRDLAMKLLNAVVELQPDYAEAWNRRAFLFYLDDDSKRALGDIRRVLALEPRHFKALEGLANILQGVGEKKAALEAYEALMKIYPTMPGAKKARDDLKAEVEGQGI